MRLGSAARDGHLRKPRRFYVDYRDGTILSPGQVSAAEAQQIVDGARALLDVAAATWLADGLADRDYWGLAGLNASVLLRCSRPGHRYRGSA